MEEAELKGVALSLFASTSPPLERFFRSSLMLCVSPHPLGITSKNQLASYIFFSTTLPVKAMEEKKDIASISIEV